jgi:proline dehydrogenase
MLIDKALASSLRFVPRSLVRYFARPYIAGPSLTDAIRTIRRLNDAGKMATVDVLGEQFESRAQVAELVAEYRRVFDAIQGERLDANVSVKMTGLGLRLDPGLCLENLRQLSQAASSCNNFMRIDMEDSGTLDATLDMYRTLRDEGFTNVGIVLQAYLRRLRSDLVALAPLRPNVRLWKGIWIEDAKIAFHDRETIRRSYAASLRKLFDAGSYVGIASHDEWVHAEALRIIDEYELDRNQYEFQMLLGVQERLGDALVAEGHRLRIYVPYGRYWYEYSTRRLNENPALASHIARDSLRRLATR